VVEKPSRGLGGPQQDFRRVHDFSRFLRLIPYRNINGENEQKGEF